MKPDKIEVIYQKYYSDIMAYAYSLSQDYYISQYLVSDTFYKAFLYIDKLTAGESPPSRDDATSGHKSRCIPEDAVKFWLFRVCRNDYLNMRRQQSRNQPLEEEGRGQDFGHGKAHPEDIADIVIKREEKRILYHALNQLESPYKDCIFLHYFQDISLKDVADILCMTPGAVRTAIYRARIKLKDILNLP